MPSGALSLANAYDGECTITLVMTFDLRTRAPRDSPTSPSLRRVASHHAVDNSPSRFNGARHEKVQLLDKRYSFFGADTCRDGK